MSPPVLAWAHRSCASSAELDGVLAKYGPWAMLCMLLVLPAVQGHMLWPDMADPMAAA